MLRTFLIFISLIYAQKTLAQDTLVIKDLSNEWLYYNIGDKSLRPLVKLQEFEGNTLHFSIGRSGSLSDYLQLVSEDELAVFNDQLLIDIVSDTLMIPLSTLSSDEIGNLPVTLYAKNIDPETIEAKVVRLANIGDTPLSDLAISYMRERSAFAEFFAFSIFIILAIGAALYHYFPRVFIDYLKVSRAFSMRDTEENLVKSRPLSLVNIYFYIFLSLLSGLVIISAYHLSKLQLPGFGRIYIYNIWFGVWVWIQISVVIFGWLIARLMLIYNIAQLFQLSSFSSNHFFNHLRILLIVVLLASGTMIFIFFTLSVQNPDSYSYFLLILIACLSLTVLMIYLKLMGASGLKSLHLFSYLCTTELVPYGILLSVVISQAI
ncbi:MAG: DUF4271 domain-containing protein [Bacteroidota bacterium]